MKPQEFWAGTEGDSYTQRNRVDWLKRVPFWTDILSQIYVRRILEVGCNVGWNLLALRTIASYEMQFRFSGIDINVDAIRKTHNLGFLNTGFAEAKAIGWQGGEDPFPYGVHDLVFTCGLLIHIPPDELSLVMKAIIEVSSKYVLAIEYDLDTQGFDSADVEDHEARQVKEVEVPYRGQYGLLWKRDYGHLYQELGLKLLETGVLPKDQGFDNCTCWLMEKQ